MARKLPPLIFSELETIEFFELLGTLNPNFKPYILSCGCGVDSLALLLHLILGMSDTERGFPLKNLVIIHAVVGGESIETKRIMEEAIFSLCRQHNIWFIQAYRNGEREFEGITILSSTRQPKIFYTRGKYNLFPYLVANGTVPQRGKSSRLCTLKFKGWVIDIIVLMLFSHSPRERFVGYNAAEKTRIKSDKSLVSGKLLNEAVPTEPVYFIGYNAEEVKRRKDKSFGPTEEQQNYSYAIGYNHDEASRIKESANRNQVFRFPLIEWGFDRQWCEDTLDRFLVHATDGRITHGKKSFCRNGCPFSECNGIKRKTGNNTHGDLRLDWLLEPQYGAEAAFIEHLALAINVHQPLYTEKLVVQILEESGNSAAIALYNEMLSGSWIDQLLPSLQQINTAKQQVERLLEGKVWAVYVVRRIFDTDAKLPFRQTQILLQFGTQQEGLEYLQTLGDRYGKTPELEKLSYRVWTVPRPESPKRFAKLDPTRQLKPGKPERPFVEEQLVLAPATVYDKMRVEPWEYAYRWAKITGQYPQILGMGAEQHPSTTEEQYHAIKANRTKRKAKRVLRNSGGSL